MTEQINDSFRLYELRVDVEGDVRSFVCSHKLGTAFLVRGENICFNSNLASNNEFSFYSLAALLPLLAAKQRFTEKNDWMTTDESIACPDPNCGAKFVIYRQELLEYSHAAATKVPLS